MVAINGKNQNGIDFSIMPTLECNLKCSFCMYDCSADSRLRIDLGKLWEFLRSIPTGLINSFGLYGGEPSINIPLYKRIIAMLPLDASLFIITNGVWSKPCDIHFIEFVLDFNLKCFISSTPEHRMFQDTYILKSILRNYDNFIIKDDDTQKRMLPMGRNKSSVWDCAKRCLTSNKPRRFAVMPNGDIIFQLCDGVYPVVGNIDNPFNLKKYLEQIIKCQKLKEGQ